MWELTEEEVKLLKERFHQGLCETRRIIGELVERIQHQVLLEEIDAVEFDIPVKFVVSKNSIKVSIDLWTKGVRFFSP